MKNELKKVFEDELEDVKENVVDEVENLLPETPRLKGVSFSEIPVVKEDIVEVGEIIESTEPGNTSVDDSNNKKTQTDVEMGLPEDGEGDKEGDDSDKAEKSEDTAFLEGIMDEDEK